MSTIRAEIMYFLFIFSKNDRRKLINSQDFPLYTKRICKQVMDKIKQDRRQDKRRRDAAPATTEQLQALVNKYGKGTQLTIFN